MSCLPNPSCNSITLIPCSATAVGFTHTILLFAVSQIRLSWKAGSLFTTRASAHSGQKGFLEAATSHRVFDHHISGVISV